jgi:hypothetical protein
VRYLLSDKLLAERTPVLSYRLVAGRDLHVYSVPDTNLAGYAVTKVRRAASGREAIALLADPTLDPRATAVLTTSDELPPVVPVSGSSLTIERGGYRIEAESPGTSLLVLPIEYSHCLGADLTTTGANAPRLLRANLTMAACGRGIDGEAAKLPIQSDRTKTGGSRDLIVGDVVDLECPGVHVAQHHVGGTGSVQGAEARDLPIHPHRTQESGTDDLIVGDIVDLECTAIAVPHYHVGFAGHAAEIAKA